MFEFIHRVGMCFIVTLILLNIYLVDKFTLALSRLELLGLAKLSSDLDKNLDLDVNYL